MSPRRDLHGARQAPPRRAGVEVGPCRVAKAAALRDRRGQLAVHRTHSIAPRHVAAGRASPGRGARKISAESRAAVAPGTHAHEGQASRTGDPLVRAVDHRGAHRRDRSLHGVRCATLRRPRRGRPRDLSLQAGALRREPSLLRPGLEARPRQARVPRQAGALRSSGARVIEPASTRPVAGRASLARAGARWPIRSAATQ